MHFVSSNLLSGLLKTDTRRLHHRGQLRGQVINHTLHFDEEAVNDFLAKCDHPLAAPLTLADLLSKRFVLITVAEAAKRSGLSKRVVECRARSGVFVRIQLSPSRVRLIESTVPRKRSLDFFTASQFAHIVGYGRTGRASCLTSTVINGMRGIKGDKLRAVVTSRLPAWIHCDDWIEDRLKTSRPLLRRAAVDRLVGSRQRVDDLLSKHQLRYIYMPYGSARQFRFDPLSVDAFVEYDEIADIATLVNIFGVTESTIRRWRHLGWLTCTVHQHADGQLKKACILSMLAAAIPRGMHITPDQWYDCREHKAEPLLNLNQVAACLNVSRQTAKKYARQGLLLGVTLPNGQPAYTERRVQLLRKKLQHAKR